MAERSQLDREQACNTMEKDEGIYKLDQVYDQLILDRQSSSGMTWSRPPKWYDVISSTKICRFLDSHYITTVRTNRFPGRNRNISSKYNFNLDLYTRTFPHFESK